MFPSRRPECSVVTRNRVFVFSTLCLLAVALSLCQPGYAQSGDLVVTSVNPSNRVSLAGHHPAWASVENDRGAVPANLPLGQLALVLARSPQQQRAFEQFLKDQQDPASTDYHHWITPVEMGERFGASQHDIDAIKSWLDSQNLHMTSVANSRVTIRFSGSASAVANAFGAEMHYFLVDGEQRISIVAEPQIPAALAGVIKSVSGLSTVKIRPQSSVGTVQVPVRNMAWSPTGVITPDLTASGGSHFLSPADFATIYDLNVGGITGAGQTIAIIGESRVNPQDITNFQTLSGLAPKAPTEIIPPNGVDPGPALTAPPMSGSLPGVQTEATLDVSRATSIAPGATIDLVVSGNITMGSGLDIAIEYVVDTNPVFAHIMTISFGGCESLNGQSGVTFFDSLFTAAAAEGISVSVSSGDSGAAGCDAKFTMPPASQVLSPNLICSSSHVTCVGGTEFADLSVPSQYWASSASGNLGSALSYIPEGAWNEPLNSSNQPQVAGSGGGVSAFIPTPSWQTGTGVPGTQGRYTPDIAFSASVHDAYFGCLAAAGPSCVVKNGSFSFASFAGTSAAAPDMAGITALLNQKVGSAQGELNANLYRLSATPSNNVFHDVTVASSAVAGCTVTSPSMCNNSTPSSAGLTGVLSGYLVGVGYDTVTGLGSIDVANLLANWGGAATTTTVTSSLNPFASGASVTFAATVTTIGPNAPTSTVAFFDGSTLLGTGTLNGSGHATLTTSNLTAPGPHSITAFYNGDATNGTSTSSALTVTVNAATFTLTANAPTSQTISSSQSATYTLTVTPNGSYTSQVSFACSFAPASSGACTFSPSTITPNASTTSTTLTISGAQAAGEIKVVTTREHRITPLYGWWLVMDVGGLLLLWGGNRSRLPRLKHFSVAGALLATTLIMVGCGSAASTPNPAKTYQVTITASAPTSASGSSASVNLTQTVSLTVQ